MNPPPRSATKVAIVDDHALFAESLALTLQVEGFSAERFELRPGGTLAGLLATILRNPPRIVLLDLDLGRIGDGMRIIDPFVRARVTVVVITGSRDRARWGEALLRGAASVLAKTVPLNEVVSTVRRIHEGFPVMDREQRQTLIREWHAQVVEVRSLRTRLEMLTRREQEVLGELMLGHQVREIAEVSVVSEATVRTQVKSILSKLEMSSQLAVVSAAFKVGWRVPAD